MPFVFKSRPVYAPLNERPALRSLMVADGEGGQALLDLAARSSPALLRRAEMIYAPGPDLSDALRALGPLRLVASRAAALAALESLLAGARMGTDLYLAGTETLIGQGVRLALAAGLEMGAIQGEHRGTLARRVQCVHCKGFTEDVRTQPVVCAHCGLTLFVRDHYSRRLAAFQGVCVDAEAPGVTPPQEVAFP